LSPEGCPSQARPKLGAFMTKKWLPLAVSLALASNETAVAQPSLSPTQEKAVYVVTYIEVAPPARDSAAGLLRQLADASRRDEGNARFEILQRMAPSNQFAVVAVWTDQNAHD